MATIGDRIGARRRELGMTMEALAQRLGYKDKSSVSKIESGRADIPQARIAEFAAALNTTVAYLMGIGETTGAAGRKTGQQVAGVIAATAKGGPTQKETEQLLQTYAALTPAHRKRVREYAALQLMAEQTETKRKK